MSDEAQSPDPPIPRSPDDEVSDFTVLNGGVDFDVVKIDGSWEKVKVLQLPISKIGEWGNCQGDEAYLVELLCDRVDRSTFYNLTNARMAETRVQMILFQAPIDQIETIEKRLKAIRAEIAVLESKPRWSDTVTHESAAAIRALGLRLNKKKFVEQTNRTTTDSKEVLEMMPPDPAAAGSPSPSSSPASQTSAESATRM